MLQCVGRVSTRPIQADNSMMHQVRLLSHVSMTSLWHRRKLVGDHRREHHLADGCHFWVDNPEIIPAKESLFDTIRVALHGSIDVMSRPSHTPDVTMISMPMTVSCRRRGRSCRNECRGRPERMLRSNAFWFDDG